MRMAATVFRYRFALAGDSLVWLDEHMAGNPPVNNNERAALLVQHFGDRVLLVFSHFCFLLEFKKDQDLLKNPGIDARGFFILPAIRNACLITTLMAVRDLDDFLSCRGARGRPQSL